MINTISPSIPSVSVMSLNLRFGHADDGPNNWIHRQNSIQSLISVFTNDFYAFQEANNLQIKYLSDILPSHKHIGQRKPAPKHWQNNVIFYHKNWICIYYTHFYLSSTPNIPSKFHKSLWPRQCTFGIFKNGDQNLIVVNTHFDFEADVQVKSAQLIRKRLRRHAGKGPIILMGDFNATSDSASYLEFTSKADGRPKFFDAFKKPSIGTNHGFNEIDIGDAVDWILYSGNLMVNNAQIITNKFSGRYPSDHYPLIANFGFR
jgi:endonuclease/exonuclease/phosphatase family metal-dependent hydrolase